jgi:ketosteroid isomerase-like protein
MSEQENLQTVQRFHKGVGDGDIAAVSKLMTNDVDWKHGGTDKLPWSVRRRGPEGVEQYGREVFEALEFQEFEPDEFIFGRDSVVVLGHERCLVRATGRVVNANWAQIFTFRGGRICRFREYTDTAAWEVGISEK